MIKTIATDTHYDRRASEKRNWRNAVNAVLAEPTESELLGQALDDELWYDMSCTSTYIMLNGEVWADDYEEPDPIYDYEEDFYEGLEWCSRDEEDYEFNR